MDQYSEDKRRALQASCPTNVFGFDEITGAVVVNNAVDCIFCRECIYLAEDFRKAPEDPLGVDIKHSPNKFTFTVETNGALTAEQVVASAIEEMLAKLNRLQVAAAALPPFDP